MKCLKGSVQKDLTSASPKSVGKEIFQTRGFICLLEFTSLGNPCLFTFGISSLSYPW